MKKRVVKIISLLAVIILPLFNFIGIALDQTNNKYTTEYTDISPLVQLDSLDIAEIESEINSLESIGNENKKTNELKESRIGNKDILISQIKNGDVNFRELLSSTLIVGDSLMHAITTYGILDKQNTITQVSASLYHLNSNIDNIISLNPSFIVLHYGINMLYENEDSKDWFIDFYSKIITEIQEKLPETKIYISSIFNVREDKIKSYPQIQDYNIRLKKMSEQLGIFFIDNTSLLTSDSDYYYGDGIHLCKDFYLNEYLPNICTVLGL